MRRYFREPPYMLRISEYLRGEAQNTILELEGDRARALNNTEPFAPFAGRMQWITGSWPVAFAQWRKAR